VFAIAQAPPMVIGGPQGIDVTRILSRNWMAIPIMTDTPAVPLTGAGWPGRGYIVHVAKANDTTVWHYTGGRWQRIGGAAENRFTQLITGGGFTRSATLNRFTIEASTYYINGQYYSSPLQLLLGTPKAQNANGRIDVVALDASGPVVIAGTEATNPVSPTVASNRIKLGFVYYRPFDSLPTISGNGIDAIFRKPGVDSIFFSTGDTTLSIKDSIGISRNDTAAMLNPYKFTAANGLTKDSTVFRLGGTLNQNTNIELNSRRISFIAGADTTRIFSNGRLSIGGNPDSTNTLNVNGNTRVNGILRTTSSSLNNASVIMNANSIAGNEASLVWGSNALNLPSNVGIRNVVISTSGQYSSLTGEYNTIIGRGAGLSNSSGNWNVLIGADAGNGITNGVQNTIIGGTLNSVSPNYSRTIQLISGGYENNRPDTALFGLTERFAFIGGGDDGQTSNQPNYINDYYFGGGHRVRLTRDADVNFYAPSAKVATTDSLGANFSINAGRGTGQGRGGSVIFRTSDTTTAGTTLQTLTERVRITPRGNLLVGTSADSIWRLDVNGKARISDTLTLSTTPVTSDTTANDLLVINSSNGQVRRYTGAWYNNPLEASATLDFPSTNNGNESDLTITVTGASEGDVVSLGIPNSVNLNHSCFTAWVSATNTVTVRFNNYGTGALNPVSATFKVKVFK